MTNSTANIVICGAGMAGVAAAYRLAVKQQIKNIVLVDDRPPLTLTSNKGNEGYRNWWPDEVMTCFMNHSIDLLETLAHETGNRFQMNRRGYAVLTADAAQIPVLAQTAADIAKLGAGQVREYPNGIKSYLPSPPSGFDDTPSGVDLLDGPSTRQHYPFVADDVAGMMHVRRCGWLDTQKLGHGLLQQAQAGETHLVRDKVVGVTVTNNRVQSVQLQSGNAIDTDTFVAAPGPYLKQVGAMLGLDIPVFTELHSKIAFKDELSLVPPDAPYMIWNDPVTLSWSESERQAFAANQETRWLLDEFPASVRFRIRPPHSAENPTLLGMWSYDIKPQQALWPPTFNPHTGEIILRGLSRMIPGLSAYFGHGDRAQVDGGYYCKTDDNRPIIGPLPVKGAFVIGALSGYGIMASQAAAELLAAHITGDSIPAYADAFRFERLYDEAYLAHLKTAEAGQL